MATYKPDVVTVTLVYGGEVLDTTEFDIPLIVTAHNATADAVDVFTSANDVLAAGHADDSPAYKMATLLFQGIAKPTQIMIGKRALSNFTVSFTPVNSTVYTLSFLSGTVTTTVSYTSDVTATATEIAAGLEASIVASPAAIAMMTPTVSGSNLVLTPITGQYFDVSVDSNSDLVRSSVVDITTTLTNLSAVNNTWFWLLGDSHVNADILQFASYAESNDKIYCFSSQDTTITTATAGNILAQLMALSYKHTWFGVWNSVADSTFPEAGCVGCLCSAAPGTTSAHVKVLVGVAVESMSATIRSNIIAQNGNIYVTEYGVASYRDGRTVSGYYVDYISHSLWFKYRLKESIYGLFRRKSLMLSGVHFTTDGLLMIKNAILTSPIGVGINNGSIANEIGTNSTTGLVEDNRPSVVIPARADITTADIASRTLNNVVVTYIYAGFVDYVAVTVNVLVNAEGS